MRRLMVATLAGLPPALGLALGAWVADKSKYKSFPLWTVWAPLGLALGLLAGALFVYGWRRWADLVALQKQHLPAGTTPVRRRDVAVRTAAYAIVGVGGVNVTAIASGQRVWALPPSGATLVTFMILTSIPLAGVAYGVRRVASQQRPSLPPAQTFELLMALRRLLQRLLATGGGLLALVVFHKAAELALQHSANATSRPAQYVLIYGGFGSLLLALVYVPARAALQRRAEGLRDELFPMTVPDEPAVTGAGSASEAGTASEAEADKVSALLRRAGDRQKFEGILGADRGILADIETGLPILAPLLAGAVAAFLPH